MKRIALAVAVALVAAPAFAADHGDGAAVKADPSTDITDVFAWMSPDAGHVYLVLDVYPNATTSSRFSNAAKYAVHVTSAPSLGMPAVDLSNVICTFADGTAKTTACWVVDAKAGSAKDYVAGDASAAAGATSASGAIKVFAGLRDDPFFFNLAGFKDAAGAVHAAALQLDANGCPTVDAKTSASLVGMLSHTAMGAQPATDFFAKQNVLSIAIAVDKSLLASSGNPILSVYATTNK